MSAHDPASVDAFRWAASPRSEADPALSHEDSEGDFTPSRAEGGGRTDEPLVLPGREEVERLAAVVRRPAEPLPTLESIPDYHQTAAEFSESMVLGRARHGASRGWRRSLGALTGGLLTLPPGRAEQRHSQYLNRVRAPIDGTRRIVVMSRKGGVGKTTVTVGVGATFASVRGDRVVAVDANPDAGNLARRIAGDCQRTITDLLADAGRIKSFATMRGYTSQCIESRLEVLASDDDAKIAQALGRTEYEQIVSLLDHYYNLILLDTGTGILDSANQGLTAQADQLVLVVRPALDGARAGAQTLDWLEEHGHKDLVASAVVTINGIDRESDPIVAFSRRHFAARCAHVTTIPWDRALEAGGRTTLSSLERRTRDSFVDVAAALADGFAQPPRKHRVEPAPVPAVPMVAFEEDDPADDVPAFLQ
jgi:putative peptide zinc metalloprotease protein